MSLFNRFLSKGCEKEEVEQEEPSVGKYIGEFNPKKYTVESFISKVTRCTCCFPKDAEDYKSDDGEEGIKELMNTSAHHCICHKYVHLVVGLSGCVILCCVMLRDVVLGCVGLCCVALCTLWVAH